MYQRIMVPVDLAHVEKLEKALTFAADLSRQYGAEMVVVGASGTEPSAVARSPEEYATKLAAFAQEAGARLQVPKLTSAPMHLHDVTIDLDKKLIGKAREIGADLVVMGSHRPGLAEHLIASNAGYVAMHAPVSVMIVRD